MTWIGSAEYWEELCMEARAERDALARRLAKLEMLVGRPDGQEHPAPPAPPDDPDGLLKRGI